ncbi:hypothetical protein [Arthrobacter psychrochitiniphilus]|nr:hypothetical protein [Arthrobacter psychrochitiniphilus]NYG18935.1 hypothetical protein [Arthrobacter psychrochitiniphilus]
MNIQWMREDDVFEYPDPATYRVRIWTPPVIENYSWAVDEYEVTDVQDVRDALAWAENEAAGRPMEFFVKWFETQITSKFEFISTPQMTKLFGLAPKED